MQIREVGKVKVEGDIGEEKQKGLQTRSGWLVGVLRSGRSSLRTECSGTPRRHDADVEPHDPAVEQRDGVIDGGRSTRYSDSLLRHLHQSGIVVGHGPWKT